MIVRTGIDLIEIKRIDQVITRHGDRFLNKVFTQEEIAYCQGRVDSLAARFAAKEAVAKALGTGIGVITWREIEIGVDVNGQPQVHLHSGAGDLAVILGLLEWSLSITHTNEMAAAFVVAVG